MFGEDISIYDLKQSILDKSTVNIFYDKQVSPLVSRKDAEAIDLAFEEATEGKNMRSRNGQNGGGPGLKQPSEQNNVCERLWLTWCPHRIQSRILPPREIDDRLRNTPDLRPGP